MADKPTDKRLAELEAKWLNGTISEEEAQEYAQWYNEGQDDIVEISSSLYKTKESHRKTLLTSINRRRSPRLMASRMARITAAAAVLLVVFLTAREFLFKPQPPAYSKVEQRDSGLQQHDILPGTDKATLTLSDGRKILLDTATNGFLTKEGNMDIHNKQGNLVYTAEGNSGSVLYNTLSTNRGEQYPVVLCDGTKVWLNASSSIYFPVSFEGSERHITITGEAYFEVAKNPSKPFIVTAGESTVKVLGTHFNVNAYPDENGIATTLLEGAVKINNAIDLKPGQQSIVRRSGEITVEENADTEQAMAWRNGLFQFKGSDIKMVLRVIEKWYDVDVYYEGNITTDKFTGKISRAATLNQVLEILQDSKIHFKLEGKKLTVMP